MENTQTAVEGYDKAENADTDVHYYKDFIYHNHGYSSKRKKPNTQKADISDCDPTFSSQALISDGINHSQVALYAGQEMKVSFTIPSQVEKPYAADQKGQVPFEDTDTSYYRPKDPNHFCNGQVEGEDIWVSRPFGRV